MFELLERLHSKAKKVKAKKIECSTCRFWEKRRYVDGECRKTAPIIVVGDGTFGRWPKTDEDYWCGEHQSK